MYNDIKIVLATKLKKEDAIKKPFEDAFNATIVVPNDYDTDQFGTFIGEIPRLNMSVINKLAMKLVQRLQKKCSQCSTHGFGKTSVTGKLLCGSCGTETELYKFKVLSCIKCDYQEFYPRADNLEYADQQYCPYCNP